jgi:hypothetical protein
MPGKKNATHSIFSSLSLADGERERRKKSFDSDALNPP